MLSGKTLGFNSVPGLLSLVHVVEPRISHDERVLYGNYLSRSPVAAQRKALKERCTMYQIHILYAAHFVPILILVFICTFGANVNTLKQGQVVARLRLCGDR